MIACSTSYTFAIKGKKSSNFFEHNGPHICSVSSSLFLSRNISKCWKCCNQECSRISAALLTFLRHAMMRPFYCQAPRLRNSATPCQILCNLVQNSKIWQRLWTKSGLVCGLDCLLLSHKEQSAQCWSQNPETGV